jgi:predicted aspartyl protease
MMQLTRRSLLSVVPALGISGPALAQQQQAPTGTRIVPQTERDVDYTLDAWVDIYGRPTAKVMINGAGPFQFMVDTGSTTTVIAARHQEAMGAVVVGEALVAGTTGTAVMPIAELARVQTGVVTKDNLRVAVLTDAGLAQADGILGADVFAGRKLIFNIKEKIVRIEPSTRQTRIAPRGNMRVRNGLLAEVEGRVGNVSARLMLDTGAQNCIANMPLSDALQKAHPRLMRVDNVRVYGVTGHKLVGQFIALPKVNLKAFQVTDAGCVAAAAPIFDLWELNNEPAMIVGVDLLSRLDSFSIDYGAKVFDAKAMSALIARNPSAFG